MKTIYDWTNLSNDSVVIWRILLSDTAQICWLKVDSLCARFRRWPCEAFLISWKSGLFYLDHLISSLLDGFIISGGAFWSELLNFWGHLWSYHACNNQVLEVTLLEEGTSCSRFHGTARFNTLTLSAYNCIIIIMNLFIQEEKKSSLGHEWYLAGLTKD